MDNATAFPLDQISLSHVLRSAASADPQQVHVGTKQLQNWESGKGYYSLLQDVFLDKSLPPEIRYLSIIQLKNGIDRYWRKTATNGIGRDEKAHIRSRLLRSGVEETDRRLALQNAVVTAKIVRFDFPHDWPDVITSTVSLLRSSSSPGSDPVHLQRSLLLLLYIIKELSTARLQRSRLSLQSTSPEILSVLGRIYIERVESWRGFLSNGGSDGGGALDDVEQSLQAFKVIRRLVVAGYEFPNRDRDMREFWGIIATHLADLLAILSQKPQLLASDVQSLIERHVMQYAKLHLEMARSHPAAFALLPGCTELVRGYWDLTRTFGHTLGSKAVTAVSVRSGGDAEEERCVNELLSLKSMLLLRACIKLVFSPTQTFKYRKASEKEEERQAVDLLRSHLFTEDLVRRMMEEIITCFFVFRPSDLRQWEEEPEEWERREEADGDGWEFSLRQCSEKLFLDLIINFKDLLVGPLLDVFYSIAKPDNENILLKDSVYSAIGLSAAVVHQQLDFDAFLNSTLAVEVQRNHAGANVLRRRISILLGQWVPVKISKANRPLVYEIFQHLLNTDDVTNDQVVRVTAGRQFHHVVDDWGFEIEPFTAYMPDILGRIMELVREVELTETKLSLLNTVSIIVERVEHHISPHAESIVALLPPLWAQAGEDNLMKGAILTILTRLVHAMKGESVRYHAMSINLIEHAIQPDSQTRLYLEDDALDLWAAIMVQTERENASDVLRLCQYLFPMFDKGAEQFRKALTITESYILLVPSQMLDLRVRILDAFSALVGTLKAEANGVIMHLVELMVRAAESLGGEAAIDAFVSTMNDTGILTKLLSGLSNSFEARQTTGPKKIHPLVEGIVETDYFCVLARLILASPRVFLAALEAGGSLRGTTLSTTLDWLLAEWFNHFGNIGHSAQRKLNCLALTKLLSTQHPCILGHLQDLMSVWTDVIIELREGAEERGGDSLLYWDADGLRPPTPEAPEEQRRRDLTFADPVHTHNVQEAVKSTLRNTIDQSGGQDEFQRDWLSNIDSDVIKSFASLGIL